MAISAKVTASSLTATITGLITYLLVTLVPSFHSGLPTNLASLLPAIVAVVLGAVAGWYKKESPAFHTELDTLVTRGEAVLTTLESVAAEANALLGDVSRAQVAQSLAQAAQPNVVNKPAKK